MTERAWARTLFVLIGVHLLWGIARIPGKVYGKRIEQVQRYLEHGAAAYHLDNKHRQGAEIIEQINASTPEHCVVLWRGEWKDALEFVPPLIAPRLLVYVDSSPLGQREYAGRPIVEGLDPQGNAGQLIVIGARDHIELAVR